MSEATKTTIEVPPGIEARIQELTEELAAAWGEDPAVTRRTVEITVLTRGIAGAKESIDRLKRDERERGRPTG